MTTLITDLGMWVSETIRIFGYWGIAFLMMLESIILPLPSEIILPFAGYYVARGDLNLWLVTLAATAGSVVGSLISYEIGRVGGRPFLLTYGKYFLFKPERMRAADRWFRSHGEGTVLACRLLPLTRYFISIPAGIARMNRRRFLIYTAIGSFAWNFMLIKGGQLLTDNWTEVTHYGARLELWIGTGVLFLVAWYMYEARAKRLKFLRRITQSPAVRENVRAVRRNLRRAQKIGQKHMHRLTHLGQPDEKKKKPGKRQG